MTQLYIPANFKKSENYQDETNIVIDETNKLIDETNNVSFFNRTVKMCNNTIPFIINCTTFALMGAFVGFCGGIIGDTKASTILDMPPISLNSARELEIAQRSVDLIDHNKKLIMPTSVISSAIVGTCAYLLYKLSGK